MTYTKPLTKLSNKDVATAGGKGASLGELMRADISVPNGFVVLTDSFDKFLDDTDLRQEIHAQLNKADQNKMHTVERASERIQSLILREEMSREISKAITKDFSVLGAKYVAVRSSATAEDSNSAAWAGQLDTYLNTTEEKLLENVKKCWASLFTPRAIFYRFEKGLKESNVSVAVVVQEMIESEKAGIAFSVHPVTQDQNQMIIEAGFGLGEAVVSGTITPDAYVISKKNNEIIDINIHNQTKALYRKDGGGNKWVKLGDKGAEQVLTKKDILKLAEVIKKIEKHYKTPQDIEWAFTKGKFYITQSRPITTLDLKYKSKNISYVKEFARNYPLFQVIIFSEFNKRPTPEFNVTINGGHPLFVHDGGPLVKIYFPLGEMKKIFGEFGQIASNVDYFNGVLSKFFSVVEEIKPYFEKKKTVKNLKELKYLYELTMDFYYGEAFVWAAPLVESLSKEIREKALSAREQTEHLTSLRDELFDYNLDKLFPKLGKLTHFVLPKRIFKGKTPDELLKKAIKYQKGYIYFDGKIYTGQRDKVLKKLNIELENDKSTENINSMKGQSASAGITRGQVKIVLTNKDTRKIVVGDILVSPMTRPDFVPAMKKAAAFVTDEGGITCHAAIVAREMKKPCIIGTKIATQVLKDGDLVEVNANEGFVHIIEKPKTKTFLEFQFTSSTFDILILSMLLYKTKYGDIDYVIFYENKKARAYLTNKGMEQAYSIGEKLFSADFIEDIYFSEKELIKELVAFNDFPDLSERNLENEWNDFFELFKKFTSLYRYGAYAYMKPLETFIRNFDSESYVSLIDEKMDSEISIKSIKITYGRGNNKDFAVQVAIFMGQMRLKLHNAAAVILKRMDVFKTYLAEKYKIDKQLLNYATIEEFEKALHSTQKDYDLIGILKSREQNKFVFAKENNKWLLNSGKEYAYWKNKIQEGKKEKISGEIAFPGIAKGRVVIHLSWTDTTDVKEGDVLVTGMTNPQMIPLLKKVSAIVTDEGGITCHAAIISRELRKPCIVGTKIATQVLKDGDLVEVNANKGIVRIIEKPENK